jgi:hypothetical protein
VPENLGIKLNEIETRSLRASGSTVLLAANLDQNKIQLLGRWKSDAMNRYLHKAANPEQQFAKLMIYTEIGLNPCCLATFTQN